MGPSCCGTLKQAKDIAVGEIVWAFPANIAPAASDAGTAEAAGGALLRMVVTARATTTGRGLHSPVLSHGSYPVVDGLVTSFDSARAVSLASYGLPWLLWACKATSSCELVRKLIGKAA